MDAHTVPNSSEPVDSSANSVVATPIDTISPYLRKAIYKADLPISVRYYAEFKAWVVTDILAGRMMAYLTLEGANKGYQSLVRLYVPG